MAQIVMEQVSKVFPDRTAAVSDLDLDVTGVADHLSERRRERGARA